MLTSATIVTFFQTAVREFMTWCTCFVPTDTSETRRVGLVEVCLNEAVKVNSGYRYV